MSAFTPPSFFGHGSPMNAIDFNGYTDSWRSYGASVPTPKAILSISAHWFINATAVTAMDAPRTIHDFYGFPKPLFDFQYGAPGSREVAELVIDTVKPTWVGEDADQWGLDHGTWSVLTHIFPAADIPVVQLSIDATKDVKYHYELGRKLAELAYQGVMIFGSGNIVHNLASMDWSNPNGGFDWAVEFDERAKDAITSRPSSVIGLLDDKNFTLASPTPDHFLPLVYFAGIVDELKGDVTSVVEGCSFGSISMAAYSLGT
ncbi:MAG: 4,5-DOPA dioxygenase extradiol [Actinomycetota bacterium]|nr:4,5-DOPA dioxygenase extradiol [Actinomycetota bacterium]